MANYLIVVRINANYRASVYDVADLKRYIDDNPQQVNYRLLEVEETPQHKLKNSIETNPEYAEHMKKVKAYVKSLHLAQVTAGNTLTINRNQANRTATVLWVTKAGKILVWYRMPNGMVYLNLIENPNLPNNYSAIQLAIALKSATAEQKTLLLDTLEAHLDDLDDEADGKYSWRLKAGINTTKEMIFYLQKTI